MNGILRKCSKDPYFHWQRVIIIVVPSPYTMGMYVGSHSTIGFSGSDCFSFSNYAPLFIEAVSVFVVYPI